VERLDGRYFKRHAGGGRPELPDAVVIIEHLWATVAEVIDTRGGIRPCR
jgi:hypothetical protein